MFRTGAGLGEDPSPGPAIKIDNNRHYIAGGALYGQGAVFPGGAGAAAQQGQGPAGLGGAGFELWVCAGFPVLAVSYTHLTLPTIRLV